METSYTKLDKNLKYHYLLMKLSFLVYITKCGEQLEYPTMQSSGINLLFLMNWKPYEPQFLIFFTHS